MINIRYLQSLKIAADTAHAAHKGQYRKHSESPYVVHPARVAQLVLIYDSTAYRGAIIAWLHDVLEDCGEEGREMVIDALANMPIAFHYKNEILSSIEALTKNDNIHPRQAKWDNCITKIMEDQHDYTKLVKICDRIDNLMDMNGFTKEFVEIYLKETDQFINTLDSLDSLTMAEEEALGNLITTTQYLYDKFEL